MTQEEKGINELYERLKKQPLFDEHVELGKLCLKHINDLTPEEKKRYDELQQLLKLHKPPQP